MHSHLLVEVLYLKDKEITDVKFSNYFKNSSEVASTIEQKV